MTTHVPKISICVPAYNYAHFLPKAIESVLSQDFEDYELIILNDVSPDNTHEIATAYAAKDPRVRYILNEKNLGAIENCNKGVEVARGEYVTFLSADDFYLPGWLKAGVEFLDNHSDVNLVYCKTILVDDHDQFCWTTAIDSFSNFDHTGRDEFREHVKTGGTFFHLAATIMRKTMLEQHGFYKKWDKAGGFSAEDWEANFKFALNNKEGYINQIYYAFRVHSSNFSSQDKVLENGALVRSHLYILDKFLTAETAYRTRGIQKETLMHLFGQVNMLSKHAPEIAEKVLPEIYPQLNDIKNRLEQLGQLPIPPLSEQPLVTVVIPTFNMAGCAGNPLAPSGRYIFFVLSALESLCQQTYTNWQAIIVNDGGEDITPLLKDFKQKYQPKQNIQYFYFNVNQGQATARNVALEFIWQGELVTFLDDDDLYLPNHLENIVNKLSGTSIPCAYTNYTNVVERYLNGNRVVAEQLPVNIPPIYSKALLAIKNYIPMSTFAVRRECILDHEVRFDPTLKILEDWEFLLKLSNWYDFTYIPDKTVEIREREQSDSVQQLRQDQYATNYEKIYKTYSIDNDDIQRNRQKILAKIKYSQRRLQERNLYKTWRACKDEYTKQNLLTFLYKMQQSWHGMPHFLILLVVDENTVLNFERTLNSLKNQYYKHYSVFVLKKGTCVIREDALIQDVYSIDSDAEMQHITQSLVQHCKHDWIFTLFSGVILNTQCFLALADHVNQKDCQLVYFDEDKLYEQSTHFTDCRFKSAFNLDLFRAYPTYIGSCLALKSQMLKTYRFPLLTAGWNYQIVLGVYDAFGEEAIEHIEDVFIHIIHNKAETCTNFDIYKRILSQHLATYGMQVQITEQAFTHQPEQSFLDIQHIPQHYAQVTILCTAINNAPIWMQNVHQLLQNTRYVHYEFVVLSTAFKEKQEALAFYRLLTKRDPRFNFIENLAEIKNTYVFYFDEKMVIPFEQGTWLDLLVGCIERPDILIDIVKPVFINQETHMPVGLLAAPTLSSETPSALLERQQLPQLFLHVDSLEGTLMKTTLLLDPDFDVNHSTYKAVYLPTVRLMYTNYCVKQDAYRWMQDPISYNKNLSLDSPFQLETEFIVNWKNDLHAYSVKKVLQLSSTSFSVLPHLVEKGCIQHITLDIKNRFPSLAELKRFAPDILVLTFDQDYQNLHATLRQLKEDLPHLRIVLVIDQFVHTSSPTDDIVAFYSVRTYLRAFDYLSKVLLVNTSYAEFDEYSDVFHCESFVITPNIINAPEEYLECLF